MPELSPTAPVDLVEGSSTGAQKRLGKLRPSVNKPQDLAGLSETHWDEHDSDGFGLLKKYVGIIIARAGDTFWARLQENTQKIPAIEAEFDISDLPPDSRPIAVEGAPVVWTLGSETKEGTQSNASIIYVLRSPGVTKEEFQQSRREVEETLNAINWE